MRLLEVDFMSKYPILFSIMLMVLSFSAKAQEVEIEVVKGKVLNAANDLPLEDVNIVNLNQVRGTVSGKEGSFELKAKVNDTLYFSYLGYKSIQVRVTNNWNQVWRC